MKPSKRLKIVVPGDDPVQMQHSPHLSRLEPYGDVVLHTDRPTTLEEKIHRAKDADILGSSDMFAERFLNSRVIQVVRT